MKALPNQKQQRGAVLILVTVALFTLLGFTALALDGGYLLLNKSRLQDAVDAAALSGAKSLADKDTRANAEAAALDTLRLTLSKDGYGFINVDSSALAAAVVVEFSDNPVPFQSTNNPDAEYIRVRMESVPVTQFLSQIATSIWQVRVSALAGPLDTPKPGQICDVIPLLMCAGSGDNFGYKPADLKSSNPADHDGDIILIKSPAPGSNEMGPGNFKAIRIGGSSGANDFREGLAGGHCINVGDDLEFEDESVVVDSSEPGNMHGPTKQGINTRFGIYKGKLKDPSSPPPGSDGDYYSDSVLSSLKVVDFSKTPLGDGESVKLSPEQLVDKKGKQLLQRYKDYVDKDLGYAYKTPSGYSIENRRLVKVPVANCSNAGGRTSIETVGVACMFLNQEADGQGNDMYLAAEFVSECPAGGPGGSGTSGPFKLVLFDDSDSGDS